MLIKIYVNDDFFYFFKGFRWEKNIGECRIFFFFF